MANDDMKPCACGCGTLVAGTWARGHARRGRADPGPPLLTAEEIDGADDVIDLGEVPFIPDEGPPERSAPRPPASGRGAEPPAAAESGEGPAHGRRGWARAPAAPRPSRSRGVKITASIRADITAKIAMPLEIGGQIWRARDPLCGGVFLQQRPDVAEALTDIVCESADLVAFFTGPGGAFMRYLNLGAALWPVAEVLAAHHVWHSVAIDQDGAVVETNAEQYAA